MGGGPDPASGVKAFSIGGRMIYVRQRLLGMTDSERQWRAQYLKDQMLSRNEPRNVPELYKDTTNFMRRLWRTPMWNLQKAVSAFVGKETGYQVRKFIGKTTGLVMSVYLITYFLKYHGNDWTNRKTWICYSTQRRIYPHEPNFPNFPQMTEFEFYNLGFLSSPLARKIEAPPPEDSHPKPVSGGIDVVCPQN